MMMINDHGNNDQILLTFCVSTRVPDSMKSLTKSLSPLRAAKWSAWTKGKWKCSAWTMKTKVKQRKGKWNSKFTWSSEVPFPAFSCSWIVNISAFRFQSKKMFFFFCWGHFKMLPGCGWEGAPEIQRGFQLRWPRTTECSLPGWVDGWMDGWMDRRMDGWMDEQSQGMNRDQ